MKSKSFPTQFEKLMKQKIADELGLISLNQNYNVDFVTNDWRVCIELKLRQQYENKKFDHFSPRRKQLSTIEEEFLRQKRFDSQTGRVVRTKRFDYFFFKYTLPVRIESIGNISEIIDDVRITVGYFTDYRFVVAYDTGGAKSPWHSITETILIGCTTDIVNVRLANSTFSLYLVPGKYRYIPDLAKRIFKDKIISSH